MHNGTVVNSTGSASTQADDVRSWSLVRLRWGSAAGQFLIILGAWRLASLPLPVATLLVLASVSALSNLALWLWLARGRSLSTSWTGAILAFDTLQLTALLYASEGATNPFSVFYLVQITAAASLLGSGWTWSVTALAISCYAALFALPPPVTDPESQHMAEMMAGHLRGMWIALSLAAALTAFFVTRLTIGLARRDREILEMRERAARFDRLAAVTTLAAGAAHELATPLTTVAVIAGELEGSIAGWPGESAKALRNEVHVIREEVVRCREILDSIGLGAGNAVGEMPAQFAAAALVGDLRERLRAPEVSRLRVHGAGDDALLFLPRRALGRVLLSLVRNAFDASPEGAPIHLDVEVGGRLSITVRDEGTGMAREVLDRVGDPFFTTKPPGQGLGLGLFLTRSLAEQLGGRFDIESAPARGTRARLDLPLHVDLDQVVTDGR